MNFKELWTDWPVREINGLFKWYYLVQYAFWIQQIFVLNIEERRKDFHQMFAHHLVTCSLIYGSYVYHLMRVGNVILCVMDVTDILLPVSPPAYKCYLIVNHRLDRGYWLMWLTFFSFFFSFFFNVFL